MEALRLIAPIHNRSGYAKAGRALLAAARRVNMSVELIEIERRFEATLKADGSVQREWVPQFPTKLPDFQEKEILQFQDTKVSQNAPTLIMGNPHALSDWGEFTRGKRLGLTMWETERVPESWARSCENVDMLLVPSRWNLEAAERQVVRPRKRLMPLGVDERCWKPDGVEREVKNRPDFLFVSVFSTCERKGWRLLMQAFAEEFRGESVGLLVKPTRSAEVEELAGWCRAMGSWVEVVKESLSEAQMSALYRVGDAYVLPSAEGFGLPFVEAAMCGVPVIGLDGGGAQDVLTTLGGMKVPCRPVSSMGLLPQIYGSDNRWHACEIETLKRTLRRAYERVCAGKVEEGEALAERAVRAYGLTALGERLLEVVEEVQETNISRKQRKVVEKPLAVIVTTHNHFDKTQEAIRALQASTGVAQIVLADDGSSDETRAWAEREGICLLPLSGGNVSANRQVAVEYLRDTLHWDGYIAFMDNDVTVPADWWTGLQRVFAEEPTVGVLAPLKRYASGKIQNVGNRLLLNGGSVPCLLERGRVLVDYVETACMVVRPDVWRSIRWDSRFPLFYEDVDYCFQARTKGFQVMATAEISVVHDAHTTSGARACEADTNRMRFLQKWKAQL